MEINKNDTYKLNLDDLSIDSFEPVSQPDPTISAMIEPNGRMWTGCMSECTECGAALV